MKKHIIAALMLSASSALATVTLQIGTTTTYASNWADADGTANLQLAWGIVIDAAGDGFDAGNYSPAGINFSSTAVMIPLTQGDGGASDDVLFISPNLMTLLTNTNDSGVVGNNRMTTIANVPLTGLIGTGDNFRLIWFDRTALTGSAQANEEYGIFENAAFVLPADSATVSYASVFAGADPLKQMTNTFVPEPSTALLGLLGVAGLIRRRR